MKKETKIVLIIVVVVLLLISIVGVSYILKNNTTTVEEKENKTGKVYTKDIKTITIKYYNGYNIETGDSIKDSIPSYKIELKGNDLNKVSKLVYSLTYYEMPKCDTLKENCINLIYDQYELIINNNFSLYLDSEYGFVKDPYNTFKVPKKLYNIVSNKVKKNNDGIYKTLNSSNFTIIYNGEKLEVTDKKYIEELSNYRYYKVNEKDETFKDFDIEYTLDLNDGRKLEFYRQLSTIPRLYNKDGSYIYIHAGDLSDLIEKIYKNSKVNINIDNASTIKVTFKGNEYNITDKNKIEEIVDELKHLQYTAPYYTESMSYSSFDDNDIIIYINNCRYVIPGEAYIGNRNFIDESGKVYDVSDFYKSNTEKYIKQLVNYEG